MIITRSQALQQGLKYYFTGNRCPNGHVSKRKVHNSTCYDCAQEARTIRESKWRVALRQKLLDKFGNKCGKCGFTDIRALQIDHVNGGGSAEKRSMRNIAYYKKILDDANGTYQLLCANCNWIKRVENKE